ncbi:MAG: hypothetical protein ACRBB0_11400 [Pelagimonas sp.]|uniref:hypothetical protein n=1 Tax=Pelagimonas sp. TaxID=2073170 RepID=UPI003D6ABCEB
MGSDVYPDAIIDTNTGQILNAAELLENVPEKDLASLEAIAETEVLFEALVRLGSGLTIPGGGGIAGAVRLGLAKTVMVEAGGILVTGGFVAGVTGGAET